MTRALRRTALASGILAALLATSVSSYGKTTVTVWYQWNYPFIKKICDTFNSSHPDIILRPMTLFDGNDQSKFLAAISAGAPPNIVLGYSDSIYEWASKGLILPLDNFIRARNINPSNYIPTSVEFCKYQGKSYGMPLDWDPDHVLWINCDIYSQAGLDYKRPPTTTEEFEAVAAKLTQRNADSKFVRAGWVPSEGWLYWYTYWPQAFGAKLYDQSKNQVSLDHPKAIEAYEWMGNLWRKYDYARQASLGFMNEKAGMMMGGDWNGLYLQQSKKKFATSISVGPHAAGAKPFVPCSGWAYMVPKSAKNLPATYEALEFLTDSWASAEFCKGISWLPANLKSRQDADFSQGTYTSQFLKITATQYDKEWLTSNPICKTIWTVMGDAMNSVTSQKKTGSAALSFAQKTADIELKRALGRIRVK